MLNLKNLVYPAIVLFLLACGQTSTTETPSGNKDVSSAKWVKDSTKMNAIIELKNSMIAGANLQIDGRQAHAPIIDGGNTFEFYEFRGTKLALKGSFSSSEAEIRGGFYLVNDELIMVEFKDFHKTGSPYGKEINLYFDNGEIFYAEERKVSHNPVQGPAPIHNVPQLASTRTSEEL